MATTQSRDGEKVKLDTTAGTTPPEQGGYNAMAGMPAVWGIAASFLAVVLVVIVAVVKG